MRGATAGLCVALLSGCGGTPTGTTPPTRPVPAPTTVAEPPPELAASSTCEHGIAASPFRGSTHASWGSVRPGVSMTPEGDGTRIWFPSGYNAPFVTALLDRNGALGSPEEPATGLSAIGEADYPLAASNGPVTALVSSVYVAHQNADIYVSIRRPDGTFAPPVAVMPDPELDRGPVIAAGPGGRFAVAWSHGPYPMAPHIAFALIDSNPGRVEHADVIIRDAEPEGMSLLHLPEGGWMLVYTPSSALPNARQALRVALIDESGRLAGDEVVMRGRALWPLAAWDGEAVGIAFRWEIPEDNYRARGVLGFIRVSTEGHALMEPVIADRHEDPLAGFRPSAIVFHDDAFWIASTVSFSASVMSAGRPVGRVVRLDRQGQRTGELTLPSERGALLVQLAVAPDGVRGAFVDDYDGQLHAFTVGCRAHAAEPEPEAAPGPCDAHVEPLPDGGFEGLRGLFRLVEVSGDLIVGWRDAQRRTEALQLARLAPDGSARWARTISPQGYYPALAISGGTLAVAIKSGSGAPEELVLLDPETGDERGRRTLARDAGAHCIAPADSGWLIVRGPPYSGRGSTTAVRVAPDGRPSGPVTLDEPLNDCGLLPVGDGYLLAYTHPGPMSETNYLFTRMLDARGAPRTSPLRVGEVGFAREPTLSRDGDVIRLAFGGPLGRVIRAVPLALDGSTRDDVREVTRTYGFLGYGFTGPSELIWTTTRGERGTRRLCP